MNVTSSVNCSRLSHVFTQWETVETQRTHTAQHMEHLQTVEGANVKRNLFLFKEINVFFFFLEATAFCFGLAPKYTN